MALYKYVYDYDYEKFIFLTTVLTSPGWLIHSAFVALPMALYKYVYDYDYEKLVVFYTDSRHHT